MKVELPVLNLHSLYYTLRIFTNPNTAKSIIIIDKMIFMIFIQSHSFVKSQFICYGIQIDFATVPNFDKPFHIVQRSSLMLALD